MIVGAAKMAKHCAENLNHSAILIVPVVKVVLYTGWGSEAFQGQYKRYNHLVQIVYIFSLNLNISYVIISLINSKPLRLSYVNLRKKFFRKN